MRVLFDENASASLARELIGHDCESVIRLGWRGTKNGALLSRAEKAGFEVLISLDDDMEGEKSMRGRAIALVVLKPRKQGKEATRELANKIMLALPTLAPGEVRVISHVD